MYGPLTSVSNADGIGIVRETGYSIAARNRAIELFLSREARVNLVSSLWLGEGKVTKLPILLDFIMFCHKCDRMPKEVCQ